MLVNWMNLTEKNNNVPMSNGINAHYGHVHGMLEPRTNFTLIHI